MQVGEMGDVSRRSWKWHWGLEAAPPARPKPVGGEVLQSDCSQASQLTCLTGFESLTWSICVVRGLLPGRTPVTYQTPEV